MINSQILAELLREDSRYHKDAYSFVYDGLSFATHVLQMGNRLKPADDPERELTGENHITGQDLSRALGENAKLQFGFMAKSVLNSWGIHTTTDFGNIVYNLINMGHMKKSENDRREDFDDVYDFQDFFIEQFEIQRTE